ncbi:MAG: hypothetical protein WAL94_08765 [Bacteroidales bacterium]
MKNIFVCLTILLCSSAYGQWKAQTAETYDKTYRIAYVTSRSGNATLRVLRDISSTPKKGANPYDQITGQILLNERIDKNSKVQSLVFSFDDSPKIYVHQPAEFKQEWDANARKYIVTSDWNAWRPGDSRNKEVRSNNPNSDSQTGQVSAKEIIEMLKAHKKVICQVVMLNGVYGTQSVTDFEFTLQNSTKSINYLFK